MNIVYSPDVPGGYVDILQVGVQKAPEGDCHTHSCTAYSFIAHPPDGYTAGTIDFTLNWYFEDLYNGSSWTNTIRVTGKPLILPQPVSLKYFMWPSVPVDWDYYEDDSYVPYPNRYHHVITCTSVTVHWVKGKYTVKTEISPDGASGTSSGDGEYEGGEVCEVSVTQKCSPWIFVRWNFSTGESYDTKTVSFEVSDNVVCTAVFRHENTGELLYDADGGDNLICNANGDLLYNGDLVDP